MWVVYSFLTAFLETAKDVVGKKGAQRSDEYITIFAQQLVAVIVMAFLLAFVKPIQILPIFWFGVAINGVAGPLGSLLYFRAVKLSPFSVVLPLLSFNPIFTGLLAYIIDGRVPSFFGWIGILLVCSGLYISRLSREALKKGIWYPLTSIRYEPGALPMLGTAFIWGISAHASRIAISASSPLVTLVVSSALGVVVLFFLMRRSLHAVYVSVFAHKKLLLPFGIFHALSDLSLFTAMTTGIVPYIIPIKRTNIIWSSLVGSVVFGEKLTKFKLVGLILILSGIFAILTF